MGFTILPDMQAKKIKNEQKKEYRAKRRERKGKRQTKRYLKRKRFWGVLVSSLFFTILVFGSIGACILHYRMEAATQESVQQLEDMITIISNNMQHSYTVWHDRADLSEDEKDEQFRIWMSRYIYMIPDLYPFSEGVAAIYDVQGNLLCSTNDSVGMIQDHYESNRSLDDPYYIAWMKEYTAGNQPSEEILDEYVQYMEKQSHGEEYEVNVSSGYLDGDVFYYGKIDFYEPGKKLVKTYDCSPADTSGMQVIEQFVPSERTDEYDYYIPIIHRKVSAFMEQEASAIYEEYKEDERLSGATSVGEQGIGSYTMSTFDRIWITDVDGEQYILVTAVQYDYMEQNGTWVLRYCLIFAAMSVVIGCFIGRYRYVRLKAHYDFEDYQKNLTNAMAHDLKSPLMALSGMAENLKEQVHTEKRDYYAEEIIRLAGDMNHMVEQILGFSKLENVHMLEKKEAVDMRQLTDEAVHSYESYYGDDRFQFDVEGNLTLEGDIVLLRRMMDNLVQNALVHGDAGVITIELQEKSITIENEYSGGLTQKDVPRLLQAFEKDDSRKQTRGHGLGLSIVKQIAELHDGKMSVIIKDKRFCVKISFR